MSLVYLQEAMKKIVDILPKIKRIGLLAFLIVAAISFHSVRAQIGLPDYVGLVIDPGTGEVESFCHKLESESITGYDLLSAYEEETGNELIEDFQPGLGYAICKIGENGCQAQNCLTCQAPDYWNYWVISDGAWTYNAVGATNRVLNEGDIDGWHWGLQEPPNSTLTIEEICQEQLQPTPTKTKKLTKMPVPTNTPVPTSTSLPTKTSVPASVTRPASTQINAVPTSSPIPPTKLSHSTTEVTSMVEMPTTSTFVPEDATNSAYPPQLNNAGQNPEQPIKPEDFSDNALKKATPESEKQQIRILSLSASETSTPAPSRNGNSSGLQGIILKFLHLISGLISD
jgi:hypothetical protein